MRKLWLKMILGALALVVVAVALVPFFVSADTFRPMLEQQLSTAVGRKVTLGHLSFSLFSSSIGANNISISDDPAYSSGAFLQASSLKIGVEAGAFLFHRQVNITKLTIDSPAIQLIQTPEGKWNFSSIGGTASSAPSSGPGVLPDLTVGELSIKNGSVTVSSVPSTGKQFVYSKLDVTVTEFSFAKAFPFQLSASLPGDGSFDLKGTAGPLARPNAANTTFSATLALKHFDPVAAGIVERSEGIAMVADLDAQLGSDGKSLTSAGKIHAAQLKLMTSGAPSPKPVDIDYAVADDMESRAGKISDIAIHAGSVAVHINGTFKFVGQAIVANLHLAAPNLPIDQFEQLLPVFGVHLPSGSQLKGGTLSASLSISGSPAAPTITGPIEIDNTTLAGFDLGSKIGGLTGAGGSSNGGTAIQYLKTLVTNTPKTTQFENIDALVPSIGSATGSGTVSAAGDLNFNMVAKITALSGVTDTVAQATSQVKGLISGFFGKPAPAPAKAAKGSSGIPLTITGTTSDPHIHLDAKAMFK